MYDSYWAFIFGSISVCNRVGLENPKTKKGLLGSFLLLQPVCNFDQKNELNPAGCVKISENL